MTSFAIICVIIGAILLAISSPRKGGDFKVGAKDVETTLPEITGPAKIPAFAFGIFFMVIGLWMGISLFVKTLDESDTQQAKTGSQEKDSSATFTPTVTSVSELTENQTVTPELQPTDIPIQSTLTSLTPVPSTISAISGLVQSDLDTIFGEGNWYCLSDYTNGVKIRNVPQDIVIEYPWEAADKFGQKYNYGETVSGDGPATFWLQNAFPRDQCPITEQSVTKATIDAVFGEGNWYCLSDYQNGIKVRDMLQDIVIEYPWEAVDKFGQKYNYGETVSGDGPATFWLQNAFPRDQCP